MGSPADGDVAPDRLGDDLGRVPADRPPVAPGSARGRPAGRSPAVGPGPPRPSCWPVGCPVGGTVGCESAPDPPDPLPLPAALAEGRLRNQSDVAAVAPATGPAFDAPVFEMPGLEMAALEMAGD